MGDTVQEVMDNRSSPAGMAVPLALPPLSANRPPAPIPSASVHSAPIINPLSLTCVLRLWGLFSQVDRDFSGCVNAVELRECQLFDSLAFTGC
jgi:hypothetical protein